MLKLRRGPCTFPLLLLIVVLAGCARPRVSEDARFHQLADQYLAGHLDWRPTVGMMMGLWFLSIAAGNKLAGRLAGFTGTIPLTVLFGSIAPVTMSAALGMFLIVRPVPRLMGGVH